jgi:hypothetical protein
VDHLVKTEGFAIVPVRVVPAMTRPDDSELPRAAPPAEPPPLDDSDDERRELQRILEFKRRKEARNDRPEIRRERPEARRDRLSTNDLDDDGREVEHILDLQRRQEVRIGSWLVLTIVLAASLIVVVQLPPVKAFLHRTRPAPTQGEQASTSEPPSQPASPSVAAPPAASSPAAAPPVAPPPPAVENPASAQSSPPVEVPPAPRPRAAAPRPAPPTAQARPPERQLPAPSREAASGSRATPSVAEMRPQSGPRSVASAQFPGLPRVEVVRHPASASEGRGAAYAVRISDTAGRPLSGAEVMLLARMSDGSVENITLGSGPEPGSYHGAMPSQSTPVDLRVRVITSDKRVEIPLKP